MPLMAQRKRTPPPRPPPPTEPPDETRAHDLLPPDVSAPPPPRRIGLRRIVGHTLTERLLARRGWRPAGNSRRFWSKIEDDDPFLPRPPGSRPVDEGAVGFSVGSTHDVYAADRLSRTGGAGPAPKNPRPDLGGPTIPANARPRQTHTPETRTAPAPKPPPQPKPQPKPAAPPPKPAPPPPEPAPPPAAIDRRPPRIVPNESQRPSGRVVAAPGKPATVRHQLVDPQGRPSSEVRREVEEARNNPGRGKPGPPPARSLDEILGILGELKVAEQLYREGKNDDVPQEEELPRPKPRPAPPPNPQPRPGAPRAVAPRPPPPAEEEDEDPGPASPVNRSPAAATAGGSLDDLFGSADTRVKIGKRTVPKPKPGDAG